MSLGSNDEVTSNFRFSQARKFTILTEPELTVRSPTANHVTVVIPETQEASSTTRARWLRCDKPPGCEGGAVELAHVESEGKGRGRECVGRNGCRTRGMEPLVFADLPLP